MKIVLLFLIAVCNEIVENRKIEVNFEAGSRRYWFTGKDIAEYVGEQQSLDREERAAWREAQKRQVEFRMAELQAKNKKRAEELQADENHIKILIAQIEAAKEQARIEAAKEQAKTEADKEHAL